MTASIFSTIPSADTPQIPRWHSDSWENYVHYRDNLTAERARLFFNRNYLLVDMESEEINHANVSNLFTMLFCIWFSHFAENTAESLGRCLLEKPNQQAASPDLILYIGEDFPKWQAGEVSWINLDQWRVPDLVGEVSDTTLATDLDEKKQIYADLEIPEYWVVDVIGKRVLAFRLQPDKRYQQVAQSVALEGLPITLLEQTLDQLSQGTNITAASWFAQQITNLGVE